MVGFNNFHHYTMSSLSKSNNQADQHSNAGRRRPEHPGTKIAKPDFPWIDPKPILLGRRKMKCPTGGDGGQTASGSWGQHAGDPASLAVAIDDYRALMIGAPNPGSDVRIVAQRLRRWVAEPVMLSHRDHCRLRADGSGQSGSVVMPGPVMGHFQNSTGRQQPLTI